MGTLWAPGSFGCSLPNWLLTEAQQTACVVGVNPIAVPLPPTQAQLDAVAASPDPAAAAEALVQELSNQAVTQTQANTQAAVMATPNNPYATFNPPALPTLPPFCGAGSSQWISGIDNCTLLEIAAAAVGAIILIGMTKGRRR